MYLERLDLHDFRSYAEASLELGPGVRVLIGANAQGKTNLLEAVQYLSVGASHRVANDTPLVRAGHEAATIRAAARVETADGDPGRSLSVELELRTGGRNRAKVNGQLQPRVRDAIGLIRSVMFAPEDLQLVRGDPGDRRRFLDELLGQRRPAYFAMRQEYDRILRQRNVLLRTARTTGHADSTLPTWTEALATTGASLLAARIAVVHALSGPAEVAYRDLVTESPEREATGRLGLDYELSTGRIIAAQPDEGVPDPAALAEELRQGFADAADDERDRGVTLLGPHRDELQLHLNDLPARGYASHGEIWSLALSLRLASREVLHDVGEEPVVLLDDVFAELDETRRARLAARCATFEQVVVTAAVDDDVPLDGPRHKVRAGSVATHGEAPI
ncbi:MAG: DNA replication/repair protein RecF [Nitriliruptorales bacterium]|nr:DNA replication/repair protein RecF [Nitriliruptorales bacterium]